MNETALTKNTQATPAWAMTSAAIAGPVIRAEFITALLSAMAFGICARPTISSTNALWAGWSTTVTSPRPNAIAYTDQTSAASVSTSSQRATARTPANDWVITRRLRRSNRSDKRPPHSPNSSTGANRTAKAPPTAAPLSVKVSSSQASAMICIHSPTDDTSWPKKKSR